MPEDSPDPVIAVACARSGHVLVSHDKDFKKVSKRLKITQRQYRNSLHRIALCCPEPRDVSRLQDALSIIEHEWRLVAQNRPMVIEIRTTSILIHR
jgi:hypothetical protein